MSAASSPVTRRRVLLALLTTGFLLNSLDRSIVAVLVEPIAREFGASDTQLGLLTGFAFGLVYSICGLPLASWADRGRHRIVLGLGMLFWSVMTAACGLAPAFLWLLFARMGVAAGESAGTPASHALIAQAFPADRRSTALSVYGIGAPAGAAIAGLLGGYGAEAFGWRATLLVAAVPGVVLAFVLLFVLRDAPVDSRAEPAERISWRATVAALWPNPAYRHLWIGSAVHCMSLFGTLGFNAAFLMRSLGWTTSAAGALIAALGVAGAVGTLAGGFSADALSRRFGDPRWSLRVAGIAALSTAPLHVIGYLTASPSWVLVLLPLAGLTGNAFIGPAYSAAQGFAPPAARSRAAAVLMLALTFVGLGLGPLAIGMASDALAGMAGTDALRYALLIAPLMNLWAAAHFFAAARIPLATSS